MAKGFCVSLPTPVESAAGSRPRQATSAVIVMGRKRSIEASRNEARVAEARPLLSSEVGPGFGQLRAIGRGRAEGRESRVEGFSSVRVAGGLGRARGSAKAVKAVRGILQGDFVFRERVGRALDFKQHVSKHFACGDGQRIDPLRVLAIGDRAHFLNRFVVLAFGEENPDLDRAEVLFVRDGVAQLAVLAVLGGPNLFELLEIGASPRHIAQVGLADSASVVGRLSRQEPYFRNRLRSGFRPAMQLESRAGGEFCDLTRLALLGGAYHVLLV